MFLILFCSSLVLGLLVGSFLNVVIYRYGTGKSSFMGRSQCLNCGEELSWYELIPVVSFLAQGGRCRACGSKISLQYPLVEMASAILFVLVFVRQYNLYGIYSVYPHGLLYSVLFLIFYFSIVSILLIIAVYDLRHKIIPNALVYWFIGLSSFKLVLFFLICPNVSPFAFPYQYDFLASVIFFIPFWFLWFVSGGRWIGFGDAKLAFGIGALLGFVGGLSAIVLGFWIGAGICIILISAQHSSLGQGSPLSRKSEIPLAPFLILGVFIVLFSHIDVLGIAGYFGV